MQAIETGWDFYHVRRYGFRLTANGIRNPVPGGVISTGRNADDDGGGLLLLAIQIFQI
jgi:hypothetical protein